MAEYTYRTLFIDVSKGSYRIEEYSVKEVSGPVDLAIKLHLERYESYRKPLYSPDNVVVIGRGILADTRLFGVHRFTVGFRSPITRGFHVASMGGAAYQFRVNADAMVIEGCASEPTIVKVYDEGDGEPKVEFYRISEDQLERIWRGYGGEKACMLCRRGLVRSSQSSTRSMAGGAS